MRRWTGGACSGDTVGQTRADSTCVAAVGGRRGKRLDDLPERPGQR